MDRSPSSNISMDRSLAAVSRPSNNTQMMVNAIEDREKKYKVIVVGDSNVGKTTLTYRFCEGSFLDHSEATIGVDFRSRSLEIDGDLITLQLWDTAGQERFRQSMVRHYYRNTDAVVLVYDVTNVASFESLKRWVNETEMNCLPDIPKILVGNKCDAAIAVPTNEVQKFADSHNMPLFETSARLDSQCDNVDSIFITLAHKLKNHRRYLPPIQDANPLRITAAYVKDTTSKRFYCC